VSDHPEVPRVEFYGDGLSMNVEQAVERFRNLLHIAANDLSEQELETWDFKVDVNVRPCDCDSDIRGRDEYCVLHGDKS